MPLDPELNFDWPMPSLSEVADLPLVMRRWADKLADDLTSSGMLTYTPQWQTIPGGAWPGSPTNQPGGGVTRTGVYSIERFSGICHVTARLSFSSGAYGAYGSLGLTLPAPGISNIVQQMMNCYLYVPSRGSIWPGQAIVDASSAVCRPHFPISNDRAAELLPWASVSSVFANTSVPVVNPAAPNTSSIEAGGWMIVSGSYRFA